MRKGVPEIPRGLLSRANYDDGTTAAGRQERRSGEQERAKREREAARGRSKHPNEAQGASNAREASKQEPEKTKKTTWISPGEPTHQQEN